MFPGKLTRKESWIRKILIEHIENMLFVSWNGRGEFSVKHVLNKVFTRTSWTMRLKCLVIKYPLRLLKYSRIYLLQLIQDYVAELLETKSLMIKLNDSASSRLFAIRHHHVCEDDTMCVVHNEQECKTIIVYHIKKWYSKDEWLKMVYYLLNYRLKDMYYTNYRHHVIFENRDFEYVATECLHVYANINTDIIQDILSFD